MRTNIINSILWLLLFIVFGTFGQLRAAGNDKIPWTMDIPASQTQWRTDDGRARIIAFRLTRPGDNYTSLPLNIFVNKQYHSSLYPEHQAIGFSLCPGKSTLGVLPGNLNNDPRGYVQIPESSTPDLQAGVVYFYQITMDEAGRVVARWVDNEQAQSVLANIPVQAHTISRVNEGDKCPTEVYTLSASSLFRLAQYDEEGLIPGSVESLQNLVNNINAEYKSITKIIVNGHADPMGKAESNQILSEQRANTIKLRMISAGISPSVISARGFGSTSPVIPGCDKNKTREQIIECNQPNRRVEVEVYGVKN